MTLKKWNFTYQLNYLSFVSLRLQGRCNHWQQAGNRSPHSGGPVLGCWTYAWEPSPQETWWGRCLRCSLQTELREKSICTSIFAFLHSCNLHQADDFVVLFPHRHDNRRSYQAMKLQSSRLPSTERNYNLNPWNDDTLWIWKVFTLTLWKDTGETDVSILTQKGKPCQTA